ncbi:MAG: HepT-like ribonuclease domain-containing protein [Planctomycetota bacterium]|jgi:uncharacterized protein with HEPN domain
MRHESSKYLYDILKACEAILQFTNDKDFADYENDLLLRSGVERQLMIIGEALSRAVGDDPQISDLIPDSRDIINLRNVIVHGYAVVANETIWGILQSDLSDLHNQVKGILGREPA